MPFGVENKRESERSGTPSPCRVPLHVAKNNVQTTSCERREPRTEVRFILPSSNRGNFANPTAFWLRSKTALRPSAERAIPPCTDRLPMHRWSALTLLGARCKQCARPAMRMTIGRHYVRRFTASLTGLMMPVHFRFSPNNVTMMDISALRICHEDIRGDLTLWLMASAGNNGGPVVQMVERGRKPGDMARMPIGRVGVQWQEPRARELR